jgi:putative hemolysin
LDDSGLSSLAALLVLLALHAWMEFSYSVFTNFRRTPMAERSEAGDKQARRALKLSEDLPRLYVTTQLMLMLTRFAIVALVVVAIADPVLAQQGSAVDGLGRLALYTLILLPFALVTYVLGDLAPSAFGQVYADQALFVVARVTRVFVAVFSPLVWLMMRLSRMLSRISGAESLQKSVTEEEIMTLVDVGEKSGAIEDDEKEMIYSVLQFGETLAREIMVPRPDVIGIEQTESVGEAARMIVESGHSRIPVYDETIDDIRGILYAKDILSHWQRGQFEGLSLARLMRPAYFVPETKRADMLFREMQAMKSHIAVVVDEYGGTAGIITIEDLLEEIVGDIQDEFDLNEEAEYVAAGEGVYVVDGSMNLGDLNELMEVDLDTGDNDSVGGYVYSMLGRVPAVGEVIEQPEHHLRLTVEAIDNRRIRKVRVERLAPADSEREEGERAPADAARADADSATPGSGGR